MTQELRRLSPAGLPPGTLHGFTSPDHRRYRRIVRLSDVFRETQPARSHANDEAPQERTLAFRLGLVLAALAAAALVICASIAFAAPPA